MKYIVFKYTAKINPNDKPKTFYVEALTEELAREGLAEMLNVNKDILRVNTNNLPFKVRQALRDKNNTEYTICLKVTKKPTTIDTNIDNVFTGKNVNRLISTIKFKINDILHNTEEFLSKFNNRNEAYDYVRKEILSNEILMSYEVLEGVTLLDQLDGGYLLNHSTQITNDTRN